MIQTKIKTETRNCPQPTRVWAIKPGKELKAGVSVDKAILDYQEDYKEVSCKHALSGAEWRLELLSDLTVIKEREITSTMILYVVNDGKHTYPMVVERMSFDDFLSCQSHTEVMSHETDTPGVWEYILFR
jgi:hypothetical protein